MVSHTALQSRPTCKLINTVNTGRDQTLKQRTSCNWIHSSSNRYASGSGRKMKTFYYQVLK